METEAIIGTEEVTEALVENVESGKSWTGFAIAGGVGAAVVCGYLIYRFAAKPLIKKLKERKKEKTFEAQEYTESDNSKP